MKRSALAVACAAAGVFAATANASVILSSGPIHGLTSPVTTSFTTIEGPWTVVADPPTSAMRAEGGLVDGVGNPAVRLSATGPVPSATDIGYASVDGSEVAGSVAGFYFHRGYDFSVAIDYELTLDGVSGAGGIGFGIGEDVDGADSVGVGLGFASAGALSALQYASAARTGDIDQGATLLSLAGSPVGRFFVAYDASTGDVTVGASPTKGAAAAAESFVVPAIQRSWDNDPLLVSFFLRSQAVSVPPITVPALQSGDVDAVFSNFQVLSGTPIRVPEPSSAFVATLALLASWRFSPTR